MIQIANLSQNFINEKQMKTINIIGIVLVFLVSTIGNRIAPGRYCAFSQNDTVWAFGPTKYAENDREGFWVFLDRWYHRKNLDCVVNYHDNKREGWYVEFHADSLQTRCAEMYYVNDTLNGVVNMYNRRGQRNLTMTYKNGVMQSHHCLILDDYADIDYVDGKKPDALDSAFFDATMWPGGEFMPVIDDFFIPAPSTDKIVVFNSWSNSITTINILICSVLILLNVIDIIKKRRN